MKTNKTPWNLSKGFKVRVFIEIIWLIALTIMRILIDQHEDDFFRVLTLFALFCTQFYCLLRVWRFVIKNKSLQHKKQSHETWLLSCNAFILFIVFSIALQASEFKCYEMGTPLHWWHAMASYYTLVFATMNIIYIIIIHTNKNEEKRKYIPYLILDCVWFVLVSISLCSPTIIYDITQMTNSQVSLFP